MNIHTPAGLDAFVDQLADGAPVILADMGAGAGQVTYDWLNECIQMFWRPALAGLAEWFAENEIPVSLLDLDSENKSRGSLAHFYGEKAPKVNIHTPAGLDAFVDQLADGAPVILADMGAGAGQVTYDWFERMYPDVLEAGIGFTANRRCNRGPRQCRKRPDLGLATAKSSFISDRREQYHRTGRLYLLARERAGAAVSEGFQPAVIRMDYRLPDLENASRNHG